VVNIKINGIDTDFGAINTGLGYTLSKFLDAKLTFAIQGRGQTTVDVKKVIGDAFNYMDSHCAASKQCNQYFLGLNKREPISLRQILDTKTMQIFRLKPGEAKELKDLPAGYTMGWGDTYAQIGLNELMLTDTMSAASVLLHELAHVAGAPGRGDDPTSIAAETALLNCGLKKYFDKDALGAIQSIGQTRMA